MVVSKRCRICALLDTDNVPILGEYFGKFIPIVIAKICGTELDARKSSGVLICQACIIQLLHIDMVIEKLQNAVHRLSKNVKDAKLKTPAKDSTTPQLRKTIVVKGTTTENGAKQYDTSNENDIKNSTGSSKVKTLSIPKSRKKISMCKSVNSDNHSLVNNDATIVRNVNNKKFKKFVDDVTAAEKPSVISIKRKSTSTDDEIANKFPVRSESPRDETHMHHKKMESVSEELPMDITVDEQDGEIGMKDFAVIARNCILCGKGFHSKNDLRVHIEAAHMGERLKACPQCSSEFRSEQKYESHVFSEKCKYTIHACQFPKCTKRFKTVHKMELHMQKKHASQN